MKTITAKHRETEYMALRHLYQILGDHENLETLDNQFVTGVFYDGFQISPVLRHEWKPPPYEPLRICQKPECNAVLSIYNSIYYCQYHLDCALYTWPKATEGPQEAYYKIVKILKAKARFIADDVGLINIELIKEYIPSNWYSYSSRIIQSCKFYLVLGQYALRKTQKALIKASIKKIGRIATKEQISEMTKLEVDKISSQISNISSIVRADKDHYGLREWVDKIYEGIPTMITKQIKADNGITSLDKLSKELSEKYGVSESSVQSYARTPQFVIRDGYISMADPTSIKLNRLDEVICGRTINGDPYWTFVVEDRYFSGYSLMGFPPELAKELGCEPNNKILVRITEPENCDPISINWRLTSTTGASIGYLSYPLRQLNVSSGDRIRLVIKGDGLVALYRDSEMINHEQQTITSATALLERIKSRRRIA